MKAQMSHTQSNTGPPPDGGLTQLLYKRYMTPQSKGSLSSELSLMICKIGFIFLVLGNYLKACTVTDCTSCLSTDTNKCEVCDTNYWLSKDLCYLIPNIPSGYGADLTSSPSSTQICSTSKRCVECKQDYLNCETCDEVNYYLHEASCKSPTELPSGIAGFAYGVNTVSKNAAKCQDTRCLNCQQDHSKCIVCDQVNYFLHEDVCKAPSELPSGTAGSAYGVKLSDKSTALCSDNKCLSCQNNNLVCTQCYTASGYYLYGNDCVLPSSLPIYPATPLGIDSINSIVVACLDSTNCFDCRSNYKVCVFCNYQATPQLYAQPDGSCKQASQLPLTFGAITTTGGYTTCQDTNCDDCRQDYTKCLQCKVSSGYYAYSNLCQLPASLPDPVGANTATGLAVSCQDQTYCNSCKGDYQVCQKCKSTLGYFARSGTCIPLATIPQYYGADYSNGIVLSCSDSACELCQSAYTICTKCTLASGKYGFMGACRFPSELGNGVGAYLGSGTTATCSDSTYCLMCQDDYTKCTKCTGGKYSQNNLCVLVTAINNGYGAVVGSGTIEACSNPKCLKCQSDHTYCTSCNTAATVFAYLGDCVSPSTFGTNLGGDYGTGATSACNVVNCLECKADYLICEKCNQPGGYYLLRSSNSCQAVSEIAPGYGANTSDGTVEPCADTNCRLCYSNIQLCTNCKGNLGYFSLNNACISSVDIPDSQGGDITNGIVASCASFGCILCKPNYSICTRCDRAKAVYLYGSYCYSPSMMVNTRLGANSDESTDPVILSCQPTYCINCNLNYKQCQLCDVGSNYFLDTSTKNCLLASLITGADGGNLVTSEIVACQDTGCVDCRYNYLNCVKCDSTLDYFSYSNDCYLSKDLPNGQGADRSSPTVGVSQPCGIQCVQCRDAYQLCEICNMSASYFLRDSDKSCIYATSIPDQYGGDTSTSIIQSCAATGCQDCKFNYQTCVTCYSYQDYYAYQGACKLHSELPPGWGANPIGVATVCSQINCKECQPDHTLCTKCDISANYFLNSNKICVIVTSIGPGYGGNLVTTGIDSCSKLNCRLCQSNLEYCTNCVSSNSDETLNFYAYNGECYSWPNLITGKGADRATGTAVNCSIAGCLGCKQYFDQCTLCNYQNNGGYFLSATTCIYYTNFPTYQGGNLATGLADACQVANCLYCKANILYCDACVYSATPPYYAQDGICKLASELTLGTGAVTADGTSASCITGVPGCLECYSDYKSCTKCDMNNSWFLDLVTYKCTLIQNIVDYYGPDLINGWVVSCSGNGYCIKCEADYQKCSQCIPNQKYSYLDVCNLPSELPNDGWGANLTEGIARACNQPTCKSCQPNYLLCTKCDDTNQNYLKSDGFCIFRDSIADSFGANTDLGTVVNCNDASNCVKCKSNYMYCDACNPNNSPGYFAQRGVCLTRGHFDAGLGANTANGTATACTVSKCLECQIDYTKCQVCSTLEYYYLLTSNCIYVDNINDYYGADLNLGAVASCDSTGCVKCKPNINICTVCEVSPGKYYLNGTVCVQYNNIVSRYGITTDGQIRPCNDVNCINCQADYMKCVACDTYVGYFLNGTTCSYYLNSDPGWGPNRQLGKIMICLDTPNCYDCKDDYLYCVQCKSTTPQKLVYQSNCYYPAPIDRLGMGSSYIWEPCTDQYCLNCIADKTKCQVCDASPLVLRYSHNNVCVLIANLPPAVGADPSTGISYPCASTGCIECSVNYRFCTACDTVKKYYLDQAAKACVYVTNIVKYWGADLNQGIIAQCNSTGCYDCKPNRMYCLTCDTANNYWRELTYCFYYPDIPVGRGVSSVPGIVEQCTDVHCLDCFQDHTICKVCDKANKFFLNKTDCTQDVNMPAGWGGNAATGVATRCPDNNCYRCNYDYTTCFQCNVSTPQRYVYKPTNNCQNPPLEGLGISTTYYWEKCTDVTYCKFCAANVDYCTECYMGARSPAKFAYNGNCLTPIQMNPGKGSDWTSGTVQDCASTGCIECSVDRLYCTKCDNATRSYWLDQAAQNCVHVTKIVPYWGAKIDQGVIAQCNSTGCYDCKPNRMYCLTCDTANNYWRELTYCFYYPDIPVGRGVNRSPGTVLHCNDTHCLDCFYDYMTCIKCDKSNRWYLNQTYCRHVDDMPVGWGANLATGVSALCKDVNCYRCNYDYTTCFQCNVSSPLPQKYVYQDKCIYPPQETYGVGTSYYWEKCTDLYCKWCIADKTKCQVCYAEQGYQAFKEICYLPEDLETGTGADWSTGTAIRCNSTGCINCYADYLICKKCNTKLEFYLEGTWCKKWNTIADFKGGDNITGMVQPCTDRGCVICNRNNTYCTKCLQTQTQKYYLDPPGWWCILYQDIPYGKGAENSTALLKPCAQSSCSICFPDYLLCTACKTSAGYYLNESNSMCTSIQNMGKNYGPNLQKGNIKQCESTGCIDCSLNYAECIECDADLGYIILNGICELNYDPTLFVRSAWDSDKKAATASFSFYPDYIPSFPAILNETTIVDTSNGAVYTYKELNGETVQTLLGFTMKFTTAIDILSGVINIPISDKYRILDKNARTVYQAYPIQLPGVYLVKPTQTTQSATSTMDRAASTKSLITIALVSFNPMVAVSLDFLFNELFVLRLYEGPFIAYPDLILKSTSNASALPIQLGNWFQSDIDENTCVASDQFDIMGNNCLFLDNWGDDLTKVILILAATFSISLIYWIILGIYKWLNIEPGIFLKILEFANFNYGMQLFHTKMEAEKIEIMVLLINSMRHRTTVTQYPLNIVAMIILQSYYWVIALMAVSFSAEVGRYLTRSPAILQLLKKHNEEQRKLAGAIGDLIQIKTIIPIMPQVDSLSHRDPLMTMPEENRVPDVNAQKEEIQAKYRLSPDISRANLPKIGLGGRTHLIMGITDTSKDQNMPRLNPLDGGLVSRGDNIGHGAHPNTAQSTAQKYKKKSPKKKLITEIGPLLAGQDFYLGDLERLPGREERVETPPSSERSDEIPQMDLGALLGLQIEPVEKSILEMDIEELEADVADENESDFEYENEELEPGSQFPQGKAEPTTAGFSPNIAGLNLQSNKDVDPKIDVNPLISIFQGLGRKQAGTKSIVKRRRRHKLKSKYLTRFRPSTKDVMDLDSHSMAQIAFVMAESTIPKNILYRFAIPATLIRSTLLGLILSNVVGDPPMQISLGVLVELSYLYFLVKGDYKASRVEYWVEVLIQSFQISYLVFKLLSTLNIMGDELKQTVLGIPMTVSLGLVAGIGILFIIYSIFEIFVELIQLAMDKIKNNRKLKVLKSPNG